MNQLRNNILATALWWIDQQCLESKNNRGKCIDYLHERYDANWIDKKLNEAYCAKFVSIILKQAFEKTGAKSPIYSAGAADLLAQARRKGVKIDRIPSSGAFFYKKSSSPKYSGHVGIIYENIDGDRFKTIEGNAIDPVSKKEGVVSLIRSIKSDPTLQIAHIEDYLDMNPTVYAGASYAKWILLAVAAGVIYQNRKMING